MFFFCLFFSNKIASEEGKSTVQMHHLCKKGTCMHMLSILLIYFADLCPIVGCCVSKPAGSRRATKTYEE